MEITQEYITILYRSYMKTWFRMRWYQTRTELMAMIESSFTLSGILTTSMENKAVPMQVGSQLLAAGVKGNNP